MTERPPNRATSLVARRDQPLLAVPLEEDGTELVRYTIEEGTAEADTLPETVRDALSLAGAWSDLDWEETVDKLDRIRHESEPTPPIGELWSATSWTPRP